MNNDRLKYRVWNIYFKCYEDERNVWLPPWGELYGDDGYYRPTNFQKNENFDPERDNFFIFLENYIVEQCTGLKDANGILIYVGDIVECDGDCFEVVPSKYGFAFEDHLGWRHYKLLEREDVVIVGNIHENSELLEETK